MRPSLALVLVFACAALPATAQNCFGRFYTEEHFAAHPNQQVEEVFFGTLRGEPILQIRLRTDQSYSWSEAKCREGGGALVCAVQSGSGAFIVEGQDDGTLILALGPHGVILNEGEGPTTIDPQTTDDGRYILYAGRGCLN